MCVCSSAAADNEFRESRPRILRGGHLVNRGVFFWGDESCSEVCLSRVERGIAASDEKNNNSRFEIEI